MQLLICAAEIGKALIKKRYPLKTE